jgi:hypothetical protein
MTHFFQLQGKLDGVLGEYFEKTQAASDNLGKEMAAAVKCQSFYRACKVRQHFTIVCNATNMMQRIVRGCLARFRTRMLRAARVRRRNMEFFSPLRGRYPEVLQRLVEPQASSQLLRAEGLPRKSSQAR